MSIIGSTGCTPNRMRIMFEFVKTRGNRGVSWEDLISLIKPRSMSGDDTALRDTRLETERLGLIKRGADDRFSVEEDIRESGLSFFSLLEGRLLRPQQIDDFGHANFQRALAWFLAQSPTRPIDWGANPRQRVELDCGEGSGAFELTNNTVFQNFVYWARFLGFARLGDGGDGKRVTPDPTPAVRRYLPEILSGENAAMPVPTLRTLATQLPVLDFGSVRTEVEAMMSVERRPSESELSATMTLALMRLEQTGEINLASRPDAQSRTQLSPLTRLPTWPVISEMSIE